MNEPITNIRLASAPAYSASQIVWPLVRTGISAISLRLKSAVERGQLVGTMYAVDSSFRYNGIW
jgi:hypothetical protein